MRFCGFVGLIAMSTSLSPLSAGPSLLMFASLPTVAPMRLWAARGRRTARAPDQVSSSFSLLLESQSNNGRWTTDNRQLLARFGQRRQELSIGAGLRHTRQHQLSTFVLTQHAHHPAQRPYLAQVVAQQQLLTARAAAGDIDRREDALLRELAIQMQLHIAGTFELLVDHIIHTAAGIDQAGGDDRERSAVLDIARGAEETLGRVERHWVDTAGERAPAGRHV